MKNILLNLPICKSCKGLLWVCEIHTDKPWNDECCDIGVGTNCKECNDNEIVNDIRGFQSIERIEWSNNS